MEFKFNLENEKVRLDDFLTRQTGKNKSLINKLLHDQKIHINNQIATKNGYFLRFNDVISIVDDDTKSHRVLTTIERETATNADIIYEDDDVIVVNKPKNMIVHGNAFETSGTLVNFLSEKINVKEFDDCIRPGIVQRLDRNTSGLMVVAKNKKTYDSLVYQIKEKLLVRKYKAIIHGTIQEDKLIIRAPIDRSKQKILKMTVSDDPKAKKAETEIYVLQRYEHVTLVECVLATGRTHQIRAHMNYAHHPIFNDPLYGKYDGYKDYDQFLHSYYLSFVQPTTNKRLEFYCEPDETFQNVLANQVIKNEI